jgi:RNA polymerase sigma-70 factor (ECF subfamily)
MLKRREQVLIRQAKRGNAEAMEALIRGHQASLYHFMLRITGRPDVAEDMAQEAFVRVLRNLDRFDDTYRFSTWLFTIARRLWINHYQKCKPTFDTDFVSAAEGGPERPDETAHEQAQRDYRESAIGVALEGLSPQQREIVLLYHARECSIAEIADRQGLPQGTVKSHLFRARKRMARVLESSGYHVEDLVGGAMA